MLGSKAEGRKGKRFLVRFLEIFIRVIWTNFIVEFLNGFFWVLGYRFFF